jgi:cytochrome c biogenesis DsbD-like protein
MTLTTPRSASRSAPAVARAVAFVAALSIGGSVAGAQELRGEPQPVRWTVSAPAGVVARGDIAAVTLTAVIERGWHVYSLTQPSGGPFALRVTLAGDSALALAEPVRGPAPEVVATSAFGVPVELYSGRSVFAVPIRVITSTPGGATPARLVVRYQACTDRICLPPRTVELTTTLRHPR